MGTRGLGRWTFNLKVHNGCILSFGPWIRKMRGRAGLRDESWGDDNLDFKVHHACFLLLLIQRIGNEGEWIEMEEEEGQTSGGRCEIPGEEYRINDS